MRWYFNNNDLMDFLNTLMYNNNNPDARLFLETDELMNVSLAFLRFVRQMRSSSLSSASKSNVQGDVVNTCGSRNDGDGDATETGVVSSNPGEEKIDAPGGAEERRR